MDRILRKIRKARIDGLIQELNRLASIMLHENRITAEEYQEIVKENSLIGEE